MSNSQFIEKLYSVNSQVTPLQEYNNNRTKILCQCKKCLNKWYSTPHNLLSNHGCPKCKANKAKALRQREVQCIETGIVYRSIKEAKEITGISTINDCLHGRTKTAGGYHWKYMDKDS